MATTIGTFTFPKVINGSFPSIDRKHAVGILVLVPERMHFFRSVFLNHQSTVVSLILKRNPVLRVLVSIEYISYTEFVCDL